MKRFVCFFFLIVLIWSRVSAQADTWQTSKSTHFIIHYLHAPSAFVDKLIAESEEYYNSISDALGFRRYDFWLWENRAHIYIYDDAHTFQSATGLPSWSSGAAVPGDKVIHTFNNASGFFETVLPHELGHIIFREFVGFGNSAVPVWLDEGVASYQGYMDSATLHHFLHQAQEAGKFIPLMNLSSSNPFLMRDEEMVKLFYAESAGIISYLVKEYGKESFVTFCQALRDKKDLHRALASAYPYGSLKELDEAWGAYLKK